MSDIDAIIAGGGKTSADFDLGKINRSYWQGRDENAKNDLRDAFKGGVPLTADGQPDFGAMSKVLMQKGAFDQGIATSNLDLQRQNLKFGQEQSRGIQGFESGQPQQQIVGPSTSRNSVTIDPSKRADMSTPQAAQQPAQQPTVMTILAQHVPNDQLAAASESVARQLGVKPTDPIDVNDPRIANVLRPAVAQIKRMGLGQVQSQPQGQPAPVTDSVTTTQAPQAPSRVDQGIAFYSGIISDPRSPKNNVDQAKLRLESLQKSNELTPLQKEYAQGVLQGFKGTMQDFVSDTEARKARATEQETLTTTQREYQQARTQGYRGSLQEFMTEKVRLESDLKNKELTPDQKNAAASGMGLPAYQERQGELASQQAGSTERAKVDVKEQQTLIDAGKAASQRLTTLNTLSNIISSDKNLTLGFGAETALKAKMALQQLGINVGDLSGAEAIQKLNASLASEMTKALASRPTQFEFKTFLANNPGLLLDKAGNERLIGMFSQLAKREADIGKLARKNQENWSAWDSVVENYDKSHPIIDPVTKKVLSSDSIIAPGPAKSASTAGSAQAATMISSKADYDRLPSGASFTGPDGKPWRKP